MRRRSDISRIRPLAPFPATEPEAIELPVINENAQGTSTTMSDAGITFREDYLSSKGGDPEIVPSFPSSLAPSVLAEDDTSSTAPAISAAQKAVYRRKSLIHFVTLCCAVFCMGWNDGTTGPMLPRIQANYHVSPVQNYRSVCIDRLCGKVNFAVVSLLFVSNTIVRASLGRYSCPLYSNVRDRVLSAVPLSTST